MFVQHNQSRSFWCDKRVFGLRFLYDGTRINDTDTPASLDMEDNGTRSLYKPERLFAETVVLILIDTIDVMVERALFFLCWPWDALDSFLLCRGRRIFILAAEPSTTFCSSIVDAFFAICTIPVYHSVSLYLIIFAPTLPMLLKELRKEPRRLSDKLVRIAALFYSARHLRSLSPIRCYSCNDYTPEGTLKPA